MARTSQTQRLVLISASAALAAGGALLPSSAFAMPMDPSTPDPERAAVERAIAKADEFGSAEIDTTIQMPAADPVAMEGTYSWGDDVALDFEMDAEAAGMQDLVSDGTVRCVFVDGAYHYNVDPQPSGPLQGKRWMKVDASAALGEEGASALTGSGFSDLGLLTLADDVKNVGEETVLGKKATHYKGVITKDDLGAAKELLRPEDEKALLNEFTAGVEEITIDAWVDGNDLPVRIKEQVGPSIVTMDFDKFGPTKPIKAPPAGDTVDMTEEVKAAMPGSGAQT
ncbi:hypothetical protein [Streptomyces sp. SYSU K217416]